MLKFLPLGLLLIPSLYAQVLTVPNGGTGKTTFTTHGPLIGNGTGAIAVSGPGASGQCFISGGLSADPSFQPCPGGSSGTVTSFSAGNLLPLFTTSVATATTTPALSFSLSNAVANTVFGNFTGSLATPSFNAMTACGDATHALAWTTGTGFTCQTISAAGGGVSSVGLSAPNNTFTVGGSPVTTSGTLALGLQNQGTSMFWRGPQPGTVKTPFVQQTNNCYITTASGTTMTLTCAFPGATTAGNTIVAFTGWQGDGASCACSYSVAGSDTQGNTYTVARVGAGGNTNNPDGSLLYSAATVGGADTVTLTYTGGTFGIQHMQVVIAEIAGVSSTPFDATVYHSAGALNPASAPYPFGSITTTAANDIVLGFVKGYGNTGFTFTASSWTAPVIVTQSIMATALVTSTFSAAGAYTPAINYSNAGSFVTIAFDEEIAFKPATNAAGPAPPVWGPIFATDLPSNINAAQINGAPVPVSATSLASNSSGQIIAGTAGGIASINGNTTAAQVITGTAPISVSSSAGTTTISSAALRSINTDTTAAQVLAAGSGVTITDNGTGTHTFVSAPVNPVASITGTYNATAADFQTCAFKYVTTGSVTVNLVINTSQPPNGQCMVFMNYSPAGTITIARNGQNINGGTTSVIVPAAAGGNAIQPNSVWVWSDGTNYFVSRGNSSIAFGQITAGTSTSTGLTVGAGSSLTFTGTGALVSPLVNTGVAQGSGLKHQRVASCTTPASANGTCSGSVVWTAAFADTNYTVSCVAEGGTAFVGLVFSKATTQVNYSIYNVPGSSAASTGTVDCIAMHD